MKRKPNLGSKKKTNNRIVKTAAFRVLSIALLLSMATQIVQPFFVTHAEVANANPFKQVTVEGDTYFVNSWEELKKLIEEGKYDDKNGNEVSVDNDNLNIVINGPIAAKSTITISDDQNVNLRGQNNAVIYGALDGTIDNYRIGNNKYDSMFVVDGGTLNTDNSVVFSGKRAVYNDDTCSDEADFTSSDVSQEKYDLSNSSVTYSASITENRYEFTDSKFTYTKSVEVDTWDMSHSEFEYTPATYTDTYNFANSAVTYVPGSSYKFEYAPGDPGEDCHYNPNYVGDINRTGNGYVRVYTGEETGWLDLKYEKKGKNVFARGATAFSDDFHVGSYGGGFYLYVSLPRYYYIKYDGTVSDDGGSGLYHKNFTGNSDYIWYIDQNNGGIYSVHDNVRYYLILEEDGGAGGGGAMISHPYTETKPGCVVRQPSSPILQIHEKVLKIRPGEGTIVLAGYNDTATWGNNVIVYNTTGASAEENGVTQYRIVKNGEAASLVNGARYYLVGNNGYNDYYITGNGNTSFSFNQDYPVDSHLANNRSLWSYNADRGVFVNTSNNQVMYYDGNNIAFAADLNSMNVSGDSVLKINGNKVYKGNIFSTTSGNKLTLIQTSDNKEASNVLTYGPYYIKADDNSYLKSTGIDSAAWDSGTPGSDHEWTYDTSTGTLNHGDSRLYVDDSGNISAVDSTSTTISTQSSVNPK